MKIYLNKINESWIVDRMRKEWYENNKNISTNSIKKVKYNLDNFSMDMGKNIKKAIDRKESSLLILSFRF